MKDLIILKIGGSVITDKTSEMPKVNSKNLERISKEIAEFYRKKKTPLIIIHGQVLMGMELLKKLALTKE